MMKLLLPIDLTRWCLGRDHFHILREKDGRYNLAPRPQELVEVQIAEITSTL